MFLKFVQTIAWALILTVATSCIKQGSPVGDARSINSNDAREIGNSLTRDLLNRNVKDLHPRLETAFRDSVSEHEISSIVEHMVGVYGAPIEFEFKQEEAGSKLYDDGTRKPLSNLWYATRTTKYEKGSHFLIIEIIPDQGRLAVSSFAIVAFPLGVPDALK